MSAIFDNNNKVKIHCLVLIFGPILDLVLSQYLISENCFYFGSYRQSSNRKIQGSKRNALCALIVDVANKIILKKFIWHFLNATLAFKMPHQRIN